MDDNVNVKEIAITVVTYFVLISAFSWIGNKIIGFKGLGNAFGFFDFSVNLKGSLQLIPMFIGFYIISLFSLKNKNNLKISAIIIFLALIFLTIYDYYELRESLRHHMQNTVPPEFLKMSVDEFLSPSNFYLMLSDRTVEIVAFLMSLCKIYIKPSNLSEETDENYSEKNLVIGYGVIGYISCILIFISPYLFIGAIIGLILYQKKKVS